METPMDSISKSGMLALLKASTMTQEDIIKLVEHMQPMELDRVDPTATTTFTNCMIDFWPYEQKELLLQLLPSLGPGDRLRFTLCKLTVLPSEMA